MHSRLCRLCQRAAPPSYTAASLQTTRLQHARGHPELAGGPRRSAKQPDGLQQRYRGRSS